jgi:preprotein translocase subunit YajC
MLYFAFADPPGLENVVLISPAYAQAGAAGGSGMEGIILMVGMFVLLYFLMIRPQMKRAKEHKAMTEALQKGDEVIAAGGVIGKITRLGDAYVSLEIAPNVEINVQRAAVQTLLPKGTMKSM